MEEEDDDDHAARRWEQAHHLGLLLKENQRGKPGSIPPDTFVGDAAARKGDLQ